MLITLRSALLIGIALKLRENWRKDVAHLPAPLRYAGFTLIELSIALVIIGLIVGGVLVGQDLIRAAEIRTTISNVQAYGLAVTTFRAKYSALPGDMSKATTFWSGSDDCNSVGNYTGTTGVCDGNGNRRWEHSGSIQDARYILGHLISAKLIDLTFNDLPSYVSSIVNSTKGYFSDRSHAFFPTANDNKLVVVYTMLQGDNIADLHKIDVKYDDGFPDSGKITGYSEDESDPSSCINNNAYITSITNYANDIECTFHLFTN